MIGPEPRFWYLELLLIELGRRKPKNQCFLSTLFEPQVFSDIQVRHW